MRALLLHRWGEKKKKSFGPEISPIWKGVLAVTGRGQVYMGKAK